MSKFFRNVLGLLIGALLIVCACPLASAAATRGMTVTLLGTGTPTPRPSSFSASILIEAGQERLLFDVGRGSSIRLFQRNIALGTITATFLTHLHSDHIVGLPDLWLTGWLGPPWASRKTPLVIFGPEGTIAMTENLTKAFSEDIRIRSDDEHLPAAGIAWQATDIKAGLVYERNGVQVTAFEVNHGEKIKPAYGYIIEYEGRRVVLSGDTKFDQRVANAAKGADLLIHEVAAIDPELLVKYPTYRDIENHHTSPEDAGRIFSLSRPTLAVYSHIVFANASRTEDGQNEALLARTRLTYDGPLVIGEDLMSFEVGDRIVVHDPSGKIVQPMTSN